VSLESETASRGDRNDRGGQDYQAGHDHEDVKLRQADNGNEASGVHDGIVHRVEQSGDQPLEPALL
jgi:hypothetical protein